MDSLLALLAPLAGLVLQVQQQQLVLVFEMDLQFGENSIRRMCWKGKTHETRLFSEIQKPILQHVAVALLRHLFYYRQMDLFDEVAVQLPLISNFPETLNLQIRHLDQVLPFLQ